MTSINTLLQTLFQVAGFVQRGGLSAALILIGG